MSDPSSVYCNGLRYTCDRDPTATEPTIYDFVVANFASWNIVEWVNTASLDNFRLTNIDGSGNLIWGKFNFS